MSNRHRQHTNRRRPAARPDDQPLALPIFPATRRGAPVWQVPLPSPHPGAPKRWRTFDCLCEALDFVCCLTEASPDHPRLCCVVALFATESRP
jgi:hypothetical protein